MRFIWYQAKQVVKLTEMETLRIEFSRDKDLFNYGDNYGVWLAISQFPGEDRIIEHIEVFPTGRVIYSEKPNDNEYYNAGNILLVELLMQDGWHISLKNKAGRVTNMQRLA